MKNNYESYVNSFLEYLLLELNYSKKTGATYAEHLKVYGEFLKNSNLDFKNINADLALKYKSFLIANGYSNKTSSLNLSAVRGFYKFLVEIKVLDNNAFALITNPKVEKKLPNFLKESETKSLLDNKNLNDAISIRNNLIIEFLYATGLRVSELVSLKVSDLNQDGTIKVMGKGGKERIVFYKACSKELLNKYLSKRIEILGNIKSDYLFVSKKGNISVRSVELIVKNYALTKDIKSKVTPHTLRHTYATDLLNEGADIRSVGELLGHESLSTTQIYTHVTSERLKEVYKKTHPRNGKR